MHDPAGAVQRASRARKPLGAPLAAALLCAVASAPVRASFLSGEALDTAANVLSWLVLILVPIAGIAVFWMVHVLPEKIAHKKHHPQREAIQTLCLLSLVFGGLLWPLAWLWAYTKPVAYKSVYGTEKHEDFFQQHAERHERGELSAEEHRRVLEELEHMEARGHLTPQLRRLRERLAATPAPGGSSAAPSEERA
mgnify:CR=1 FL=1